MKFNFSKADGKLALTSPLYCVLIDFLLSELFNKSTLYMLINLSRLSVAHGCLKPMSELDHRARASFSPTCCLSWQQLKDDKLHFLCIKTAHNFLTVSPDSLISSALINNRTL